MSSLNDTLSSPAIKAGLGVLAASRPELAIILQLATSLVSGWHEQSQINAAIVVIDARAAEHIKRLALEKLSVAEQREVEIRLHELLTVLKRLGGL